MTQLSATDPFLLAEQRLLAPGELDRTRLAAALGSLHHHALDYADLYFQLHQHEAWSLEDGHVKDGSFSIERGLGVRAVVGDKTGFAYADEISRPALEAAVKSARAISRDGGNGISQAFQSARAEALYAPIDPLASLNEAKRIELMERVDAEARRHDPRIKQVFVSLASSRDLVLVAASDGTFAADVRPLVRLNVMVIAEHNGRRESGSAGGGGRVGYDYFVDDGRALEYAREAARQALVNLEAVAAPAGTMPVVLGPGWPGVLLHEAVGHGLEGDFNRKRTSAFAERMGDMVASTQCTVVDDGTLADRRGSLSIDDEGTATERTVLIENGRLTGYMQDKLNARLMGMAPTGNGRRESYAHLPMPRMTNTYMLAGEHDPGELIASVDRGLYAVNFGGGQVDITSGKFVFSASEAYLIEHGRVTRPVKGATLIGNGPEVLTRVSMVGSDMALDTGIGTCGKEGQSVPVGVGQPSMKVDALTVGGTSG